MSASGPSGPLVYKISLFLVAFSKMIFPEYQLCQAVWIQIMADILSGLSWVQIVCKGYQQATLVSKEFMTSIQAKES